MGEETTAAKDRLTTWVVGGFVVLGLAFVVAASVWSWPLQAVAGGLQVLGIALAAFGLDVFRVSLQRTARQAIATRRGVSRWAAIRRDQLQLWWLRRNGRTRPAYISGTATATSSAHATLTVQRRRVDRDTVSDREWLTFLDDRIESIFELMDQAEHNRAAERAHLNRQLGVQRDELRTEIMCATREGWELVVAGLIYSAIGTFVGIWA